MKRVGEATKADKGRGSGIAVVAGAVLAAIIAGRVANPPVEENAHGVIAPGAAEATMVGRAALSDLTLLSDKALIFYRETKANMQNPETFDPSRSANVETGVDSATYSVTVDGVQPSLPLRMVTGQFGPTSAAYNVQTSSSASGAYGLKVQAAVVGESGAATMYSYDIQYAGDGTGVTMKRHLATFTGSKGLVDDLNLHAGYPWPTLSTGATACATPDTVETFMSEASDLLTAARAGSPVPAPPT